MIKSSIGSIFRVFDKPELVFLRCVMAASAIAVVYYAGDKAKDWPTQAIYILLGLAVVGFHVSGAKKLCTAWFNRRAVAMVGWAVVVGFCAAWEGNSQLTIASQNQGNISNIHRASLVKTETNTDEVNRIASQLLTKQNEAAWKTDVGPLGAVQAKIDAAKAHKFWTTTSQCASPPGAQSRKWCDAYRQFEADKAMASRREVLNTEIAGLNSELAAARKARTSGPNIASAERDDFRTLKRLTGFGADDLEISQSVLMWLMMSVLLTLASILVKAEEYEGKTRTPWIDWRRWTANARRAWDGTDHTQIINRTHVVLDKRNANGMASTHMVAA